MYACMYTTCIIIQALVERGLYDPNNILHRYIKQKCFGVFLQQLRIFYICIGTLCPTFKTHYIGTHFAPLLKKELEEFRTLWNNHRIRRNKLAGCPAGVPDDIYHLVGVEGILLGKNFMLVMTCHSEFA